MTDEALAYAREVYAACATVGFADAEVDRLKAMLDGAAAGADLVIAAQAVQARAVAWAGGTNSRRERS